MKLAFKEFIKERFNRNETEMELTEIYNRFFFHRKEDKEFGLEDH